MKEKIAIACDHAGYEMKEMIKHLLEKQSYEVKDFGTHSSESVDYPDFAHPLAEAMEKNEFNRGFTLCGSGNGISMVVNKHRNVRAALCWNEEIARLARQHNDANVCSLPARFVSEEEAKKIVDAFLNTDFEGGRHERRVEKINL